MSSGVFYLLGCLLILAAVHHGEASRTKRSTGITKKLDHLRQTLQTLDRLDRNLPSRAADRKKRGLDSLSSRITDELQDLQSRFGSVADNNLLTDRAEREARVKKFEEMIEQKRQQFKERPNFRDGRKK